MRHLSAAFVLVVAFSDLSYGGPAGAADAANTADSAGAVTTGSAITKEIFLQKMQSSGPYWTLMTSYQDPKQKQNRTCISTEQVEASSADADTVFLQKYKFKGCTWSTYTHNAYYNVTFQDTSSPNNDLRMHWVPISYATTRSNTNGEVYGTERDYSFKYWDEKEDCFVLTFSSTADKTECELLVWNPENPAKAKTQERTEARSEDETEANVEERFKKCKSHYKSECPGASEEVLFDEYCKITETEFLKLISSSPPKIDTSTCTQTSQ
uniref:Lipocalin n=1 Tax=Amblyomma triste TaxID=251400 RepID=A0A023GEH9_AMBTT